MTPESVVFLMRVMTDIKVTVSDKPQMLADELGKTFDLLPSRRPGEEDNESHCLTADHDPIKRPVIERVFQSEIWIGNLPNSPEKIEMGSSSLGSLVNNKRHHKNMQYNDRSFCQSTHAKFSNNYSSFQSSSTVSLIDVAKRGTQHKNGFLKHFKTDKVKDAETFPVEEKCFNIKHSINGEIYHHIQASIKGSTSSIVDDGPTQDNTREGSLKISVDNATIIQKTDNQCNGVDMRRKMDNHDESTAESVRSKDCASEINREDLKLSEQNQLTCSACISQIKSCMVSFKSLCQWIARKFSKFSVNGQGMLKLYHVYECMMVLRCYLVSLVFHFHSRKILFLLDGNCLSCLSLQCCSNSTSHYI